LDIDAIVEAVTKEILKRLNASAEDCVLTLEGCPDGVISDGYGTKKGKDSDGCGYVLMPAGMYRSLTGGSVKAISAQQPKMSECCCCGDVLDLRGKRLLHERDLRENNAAGGMVVKVSKKTIVTALAHDYAKGLGAKIVRED
jgi:hypothetical protein